MTVKKRPARKRVVKRVAKKTARKTPKKYQKSVAQKKKLEIKKKNLVTALTASLGNISMACEQCGVDRGMFYQYVEQDPKFAEQVDNIDAKNLDFVETKIMSKIKDGDIAAIIFYLKTKGKSRGYVERTELTGGGGGPIEGRVSVNFHYPECDPNEPS